MLKIFNSPCFFFFGSSFLSFFLFNARLHQQPIAGIQDRLAEEKTRHQPVGRLVLGPVAALVALALAVAVAVAVAAAAAAAAAGPQVLSYDSSAADCGNISEKPRHLRER